MSGETTTSDAKQPVLGWRGRLHPAVWTLVIAAIVLALLGSALISARFGLATGPGRLFLETRLDGLKIGRFGTLKIEGLDGDVFTDFTVRRLTVSDEKGVWLDGRELHLKWNYTALFVRRFEAEELTARHVWLLRRPTLTPKEESRDLPVSFEIRKIAARIETMEAFSYRRGLFNLTGALDIKRKGAKAGHIEARSLLHRGDFAKVAFDTGRKDSLNISANVFEATGGALAGSLGLPTDRPFSLAGQASGTTAEGSFIVRAISGEQLPLRAKGAWNGDGGSAAGRIDLTASALTRGYAERIGPRAEFQIGGKRYGDGDYMLDGKADADNLNLIIKGPADLAARKLTPEGLAVTVRTGSVQRLFGGLVDAAATAQARIKGKPSDWTLEGAVQTRGLTAGSYRLARGTGRAKLVHRKGESTLTGELNGAGGQGSGYLGAALGAQPHLTFTGSRLKGGGMLVRKLVIKGPGIAVDATGRRTLFGNFSFKGDAALSGLSAWHEGADGVVEMTWSAGRAGKSGSSWDYDFDARGKAFASGWSEADRLLGDTPRLRARGAYHQGVLAVEASTLDGAAGTLHAKGSRGGDRNLDFALDWEAEGPFRAGPVEIAGSAKGQGTLKGTLGAPRMDLAADFGQIDIPRLTLNRAHVTLAFRRSADATDGEFALAADSDYGPASFNTDFRFMPGGADLSGLDADMGGVQAKGAVSLRRFRPSSADLTLNIGPGVLLERGKVTGALSVRDRPGGAAADVELTAQDAILPGAGRIIILTGKLRGAGPMARLPVSIEAEGLADPGPWKLGADGVLAAADSGYTLTVNGSGKLGSAEVHTLEAAVLRFGGERRGAKLRLAVGEGRADIDAELNSDGADVTAQIDNVALGALNEDLSGRFDARASLHGRGQTLTGSLDADLRGARGRGLPREQSINGTVKAKLDGAQLAVDISATNASGLRSNGSLVLPVEASASPLRLAVAMRRPVSGRFYANGEIKPLWDLFIGGERSLAGKVDADMTLAGTLADPRINGVATLSDGKFEDGLTGLRLTSLQLTSNFQGDSIDVSRVTATDGNGGRLGGSGQISLEREGTSSFRVELTGFQVIDNDTATAVASGQATFSRDAQGRLKLIGELAIDRAEIAADPPTPSGVVPMDVIEINRPAALERGLRREPSRGVPVALDVDLRAPRRVFVRGRGLDVEMSLDAHVGGTTREPQLTGVARVVRGEYDFAGKRFEFDEGGSVYLGSSARDIRLNLTATRSDPSLTAVIRIQGTAAKPAITLTSSPQLPSDEVLSQVLFGASASQLSPIEAAQLASALSALAGGGGFDVIGGLRGLTGLDRLTFGGGEAGGLTVAGGKYLTDDVYLEIIGGGREGPAAQVEWRVRRNLAIVSRVAGQGDARLSVRWRKDY